MVLYGHTPVPEADWVNNTICIDTGCVFGGRLTALRYPERELVSVPAAAAYYQPARPLAAPPASAGPAPALPGARRRARRQRRRGCWTSRTCSGRRGIATGLRGRVTVREENAAAALEVMSRFAVDPRWLIYLPPTMPPVATSAQAGPAGASGEAFAPTGPTGVTEVICEEKHMGSRAVVLACRTTRAARARFGAAGRHARGGVHPHRPAVLRPGVAAQLLGRVRDAVGAAGLWDELGTGGCCSTAS